MQMAVVEIARDVLGYKDAASTEVDAKTTHPVIDLMEDQKSTTIKGGTMRLGAFECALQKGSLIHEIYGKDRHIRASTATATSSTRNTSRTSRSRGSRPPAGTPRPASWR